MSLPTKTTDSPVGNALNITAGIQLLPASEAATWHTGSWTATLWFKSTTASSGVSDAKIISRDDSEYFSVGIVQNANSNNLQTLNINIATDNGSATSHYGALNVVTVNKWHHLAVVYDTFTFQVYLDGEIVFSRGSYDPNSVTASRLLGVGANVDATGILNTGKLVGSLTEVKLFNTSLAGSKIRGLYESPGSTNPAIVDSTVKFGSSSQVGSNVQLSSDGLFMGAPSLAASPFSVTPAGVATINSIKSTVFGSAISLDPDTTGKVEFKGNANRGSGQFKLNCEQNTHGITIKGPPHSASANYTLTLPNTDGSANEVLKTDGNGALDWVAQTTAYTDSSVNTHLNVSGASSGQILSWTGSDYAWIADQTVLDEDDMSSNSATAVPSQQSVKAYVDAGDYTKVRKTCFFKDRYFALTTSYQDVSGTFESPGTAQPHLKEVEFTVDLDYGGVPASIVNDISFYLEANAQQSTYTSVQKTATHVGNFVSGYHLISFAGDITGYFGEATAFAASNTTNSYAQKNPSAVYYDASQNKTYVEYSTNFGQLMSSGTLNVYISWDGFITSSSSFRIIKEFKCDRAQSTTTTQNTVQTFRAKVGVWDGEISYRIRAREISSGDSGVVQEVSGTVIDTLWEE